MKFNKTIWIGVLVLAAVIGFLIATNGNNLSVIGGGEADYLWEGSVCEVPQDCYDFSIQNYGITKAEADAQLELYDLVCVSNVCGVKAK